MQEKDDKPKRGRKPIAAPALKAKADTTASKPDRKPIAKKSAVSAEEPKARTAAPVKIQKDHSEDDKASKIAAALFGDESAASQAPAPAENPEAASAPQGDQTGQDPNAGQSNQHPQGGDPRGQRGPGQGQHPHQNRHCYHSKACEYLKFYYSMCHMLLELLCWFRQYPFLLPKIPQSFHCQ